MYLLHRRGILVDEPFDIVCDEFEHHLLAEDCLDYVSPVERVETVDPCYPCLTLADDKLIFVDQDDVAFVFIKELFGQCEEFFELCPPAVFARTLFVEIKPDVDDSIFVFLFIVINKFVVFSANRVLLMFCLFNQINY